MVGNVQRLAGVVCSRVGVGRVACAWGEEVGVVGLPEADVDIEGRGKGGDLHVVGPLAGLAHFFHMVLELLLQLLLGVVACVHALCCSGGGGRLALGVAADIVDGHVLAVKVCAVLHVLNGGGAQHLVHVLVAVELVGQGVEQAVAFD